MSKICILGNDDRSVYLRKKYVLENIESCHFSAADFIISPIPFTRDNYYITSENIKVDDLIFSLKKRNKSILITGALNSKCKEKLKMNNVNYIDLMENEDFLINNSIATAEGTIKILMENTKTTIKDSNIAVIGYGRIGKELTRLLKSFGAKVTVITRRKEVADKLCIEGINTELTSNLPSTIKNQNIIINTAPAIFLNENILKNIPKDTLIIDVASKPGGVDYIAAEKLGLKVLWELGIPSKYSPDSAADYIKNEVDKIITNNT